MTILSVVREVCGFVGVEKPQSLFSGMSTNRTQQELLDLANEMAQRIAYDLRDWTKLRVVSTGIIGDGVLNTVTGEIEGTSAFPLPVNYQRMLLTANVRNSTTPRTPMMFVPDTDEWIARRMNNEADARGEWSIFGGFLNIHPVPLVGVEIKFPYLDKMCINNWGGDTGNTFVADTDTYRLDERLLKLGMIYQWKAQKGSPYAEDMGTFGDAVSMAMGKDSPAPIIIDSRPASWHATTSAPFPPGWGPTL